MDDTEAGSFGSAPETIHKKPYHLVRLLVANHPFVDANKRTALNVATSSTSLTGVRSRAMAMTQFASMRPPSSQPAYRSYVETRKARIITLRQF
ncbi:Fic family protein [Halorubrum ezzemoulense]|uniref:Fic family protein n=1 Tax=Halorubrum ezzemoulense TaxID=337243 RepID=UPI0020CC6CA7